MIEAKNIPEIPLFTGKLLRMTPINIEKDAPIISSWTYNPEVAAHLTSGRSNPLTTFEMRKIMENWKKDAETSGHTFVFSLRPLEEERILGLFWMTYISWVHATATINLVIGDGQDWAVFAGEALDLTINYVFFELNLFRVTVQIAEDDLDACALYLQLGFALEVRQRQAIFRNGRYIDRLGFGYLRSQWEASHPQEGLK